MRRKGASPVRGRARVPNYPSRGWVGPGLFYRYMAEIRGSESFEYNIDWLQANALLHGFEVGLRCVWWKTKRI